jgi:hypothetical protein
LTSDDVDMTCAFCLHETAVPCGRLGRTQTDSYVFKRSCMVGAVIRRRFVYELVDSDDEQSDEEKKPDVAFDRTSDNLVSAVGLSESVLTIDDDEDDDTGAILSIISISDG